MATLKRDKNAKSILDHAKARLEELDLKSPILQERFKVVEYVPGYDDRESGWVSDRILQVYYFQTRAGAEEFIETHDADSYAGRAGKFRIVPEYLREFHEKRWVAY
jgi:hypothetical protein